MWTVKPRQGGNMNTIFPFILKSQRDKLRVMKMSNNLTQSTL